MAEGTTQGPGRDPQTPATQLQDLLAENLLQVDVSNSLDQVMSSNVDTLF